MQETVNLHLDNPGSLASKLDSTTYLVNKQ